MAPKGIGPSFSVLMKPSSLVLQIMSREGGRYVGYYYSTGGKTGQTAPFLKAV